MIKNKYYIGQSVWMLVKAYYNKPHEATLAEIRSITRCVDNKNKLKYGFRLGHPLSPYYRYEHEVFLTQNEAEESLKAKWKVGDESCDE